MATVQSLSAQAVAALPQGGIQANSGVASEYISVVFNNTPLKEAIWTIAKRSGTRVLFMEKSVPDKRVTYSATGVTPVAALTAVLNGTNLRVIRTTSGGIELSQGAKASNSQGVISGKITDAKSGKGVPGATVSVVSDALSVTSGEDGGYRITAVAAGTHTITVRLVGYAKQTRTVVVGEGAVMTADFKLEPSANVLDQVVVTGTAVATELKAIPSAITIITAKQIEERGITRIDQLFHGDVPGLFAQNQGSGALLDEVTMFSRGATALSTQSAGTNLGTNPIKTYLDGVELADSKYLSQIDPESIERIEILTGPQASTIYGSNAINGVMQIFTKRGSTVRPKVTLTLLSGWVENNFSNSMTPQHDYSGQLNGVENKISYNVGGSWNYMGPWTPAKQTMRMSHFGGGRIEFSTDWGRITTDMSFRRTRTENRQSGKDEQLLASYQETGWYNSVSAMGLDVPQSRTLLGKTSSLTLSYAPASWWGHELGIGGDASDTERRYKARGFTSISDTTLLLSLGRTERKSLRYVTAANLSPSSVTNITITLGADAWQSLFTSWSVSPQTLTGSLTGSASTFRRPDHNTGGFLQTQLGVGDRLFLTYGLRAEWNPSFGADVLPNYAPRYGVVYAHDIGSVTAKLRGSYGRSTRPPQPKLKDAITYLSFFGDGASPTVVSLYGNYNYILGNPELVPERQQGGEGGLELYVGTRGSLIITRYNQTVDALIDIIRGVDSVRSLMANPSTSNTPLDQNGYGYRYQSQYLNIGSIRNQGWELQGNFGLGPFITRGTYTWAKSRTIGVSPRYRAFFPANGYPQYQLGASFQYLPEHTWAFGTSYTQKYTSIGINITGTQQFQNAGSDLLYRNLSSNIRLPQNQFSITNVGSYRNLNKGYMLAHLNVMQRLSKNMDGVVEVQNIADHYVNDRLASYASIGRQLKAGMRIRL